MASSSNNDGTSCPCINATEILAKHSNCVQETTGEPGIRFQEVCFPLTFGSSRCAPHDVGVDPRCPTAATTNGTNNSTVPDFCGEEWCYVDLKACRLTPELIYSTSNFGDVLASELYYSYSVCSASADTFLSYQTTQSVQGVTLRAAFPVMQDNMHYKRTPSGELASSNGPEYYNDSIPWLGSAIEYFNAVVEISNMAGVEYTFRSIGADSTGLDPFTGLVHDVQAGLVDVAISTYWITSDRLQMTPYTTPVAVDQVVLFVPQPELEGGTLKDNVIKIFAPFDGNLWICLAALVLITASVNIWLSTSRGVTSYLSRRIRGTRWRNATVADKARIMGGMIFDSALIFSTYMFGHAVELNWQSTRAQKVLMFGFGFLILVAVASYTANLAAFLTVTGVSNYIGSMDEAIYTNTPICVHPALRRELESVWPEATFVVNDEDGTTLGLIANYEAGQCAAVANSMLDVRQNTEYMEGFCRNQLVSTGSLVLENPIAFPVNERYAGGLSYWLFKAEKQGITFQSFVDSTLPPLVCSLKIATSESDAELASLSPQNFALPIIVCCACIIIAAALHLCNKPSHAAMTDLSGVSHMQESVGRRRQSWASMARDATEANEDGDKITMLRGPEMVLGPAANGGVGGWTEESLRARDLTGFGQNNMMHVNNSIGNDGVSGQDAIDMQKSLHQVIASQELMLSMFQDLVKLSMFQDLVKATKKAADESFTEEVKPAEERPKTE